jgi:hypothetical protein
VSKPSSELLTDAQIAVQEVSKQDLSELNSLKRPPAVVDVVCSCFLHLFAGILNEVELTKTGNVKDASWQACQRFFSNPDAALTRLREFSGAIDAGTVPMRNIRKVHKLLGHLRPDAVRVKSKAAASLCKWLISTLAYYEQAAPLQQQPEMSLTPASEMVAIEACKYRGSLRPPKLSKADLVELRSMANPPQLVMIVLVCVCILLGKDDDAGWSGAKAMLADVQLLKNLVSLKKGTIATEQMEKVKELVKKEQLNVAKVKSVSASASGLFQWVAFMADID